MGLAKEATLDWFGEIITYNVQSGEVVYVEFSRRNAVGDEKISNVDVACLLATGCPSIFLQHHSTLVVLIQDFVIDYVPLFLQEVPSTNDLRHAVICGYKI